MRIVCFEGLSLSLNTRAHRDDNGNEEEDDDAASGAIAFPRFLPEAPTCEISRWHAATTSDEAAGLVGDRAVRTFSALFEPRPDTHIEYTGLTHQERGRLQWCYAARQRLSAHMAAQRLPGAPACPMPGGLPTTPRLLQCLYAELALCHSLHQVPARA